MDLVRMDSGRMDLAGMDWERLFAIAERARPDGFGVSGAPVGTFTWAAMPRWRLDEG